MFHPIRQWRSDFAHLPSRTLIEIEGGAHGGRHTRKEGFEEDLRKYLTAHLHGWEVIRIGACLVRGDIVSAVIGRLRQKCAEAFTGPAKGADAAAGQVSDAWIDEVIRGGGEEMAMGGDWESEAPDWLRGVTE